MKRFEIGPNRPTRDAAGRGGHRVPRSRDEAVLAWIDRHCEPVLRSSNPSGRGGGIAVPFDD